MLYFTVALSSVVLLASAGTVRKPALKNDGRIFGGNLTDPHEYPFAAVLLVLTDIDDLVCGGVLISNKYILTAAQCVYRAEILRASIGMHNFLNEDERTDFLYFEEDIPIYLKVHESFDPSTRANNIALLELTAPVEFNDVIQSIELPPATITPNALRDSVAIIIGWGISEENDYEINYPRHVNVTILPTALCAHYYPKQDPSMVFCSDGEFKTGACDFDEGGPVIQTTEEGDLILIGIISLFGPVGCDSGWPTAFVSIVAYRQWINERIQSEN